MRRASFILMLCLSSFITYSQKSISGKVFDEYLEPFAGAIVETSNSKAVSNFDGEFTITLKKELPVVLEITSVGYKKEIVEITDLNQELNIILKEKSALDEVVVSASRTPERILESPVTIERLGLKGIKYNSADNFYEALENLKDVDINISSLAFKSVNTRGFSAFENVRFVQLIDGMDTSAPSLGFASGNNFGSTQIDIENVEILPGAASALYGANAFNGILLMRTKNPFKYEGITARYKTGVTSQKTVGENMFHDISIRMAKAFSENFAAKAVFSIYDGEEWHADDFRNTSGISGKIVKGDEKSPNYDGVNVYGDEIGRPLPLLGNAFKGILGLTDDDVFNLPDVVVKRTGYKETDLIDNRAKNLKFSGSLHYRPGGNDNFEIILNSRFGKGNNMYQGQNRYFQKNFTTQQHKLEFLGSSFFLRGYYYGADAGDSYNTRFAGININNAWKSYTKWFIDYVREYSSSKDFEKARAAADKGRFEPGTPEFRNAFNKVINETDISTGAKFKDKSNFYHIDGNYNFKNEIDWAEIQLGGSFRSFLLKSDGNIFTDKDSPIRENEFGAYLQVQKKLLEDKLKFTGSLRYDKAQNFDANLSPRISVAYAFGKEKRRNLRFSYQTAFRNPTMQEQYIGLFTGSSHIIGTAKDNLERYVATVKNNNPSVVGKTSVLTGKSPFTNGYTSESFEQFLSASDVSKLKKANYSLVKPENLSSFELGYRAMLDIGEKILELDVNGYYNNYKNLITFRDVIVPNYGNLNGKEQTDQDNFFKAIQSNDFARFDIRTNSTAKIDAYGIGIGMKTSVFNGFDLGLSYNWADFDFDKNTDPNFKPSFNLPKHKVRFQFGKESLFENFGFNLNARWQDAFLWQSTFLDGMVNARTVVDGQINYRIPSIKSRIKLGGTNLFGKEYVGAPGTGKVGSVYYISWTIND